PGAERELRELRRLEREPADGDPAAGAVDAWPRREREQEQQQRRDDEHPGAVAKRPVVPASCDEEQCEADQREQALTPEVVHRVAAPDRRRRRRRAVDHHHPEGDERERDEDEDARLQVTALHPVRFCTSLLNSSPRCSKSRNWSSLAQAGESRTISPGRAAWAAAA